MTNSWKPHRQVTYTCTKQCKWSMKIELNMGQKLALNSLHSHKPNLGGGHYPFHYSII
jgi:hypothetical protein